MYLLSICVSSKSYSFGENAETAFVCAYRIFEKKDTSVCTNRITLGTYSNVTKEQWWTNSISRGVNRPAVSCWTRTCSGSRNREGDIIISSRAELPRRSHQPSVNLINHEHHRYPSFTSQYNTLSHPRIPILIQCVAISKVSIDLRQLSLIQVHLTLVLLVSALSLRLNKYFFLRSYSTDKRVILAWKQIIDTRLIRLK